MVKGEIVSMKSTKYIFVKQKLVPWKYIIILTHVNRIFSSPKKNHRDTISLQNSRLFYFVCEVTVSILIHRLSKTYAVAI